MPQVKRSTGKATDGMDKKESIKVKFPKGTVFETDHGWFSLSEHYFCIAKMSAVGEIVMPKCHTLSKPDYSPIGDVDE